MTFAVDSYDAVDDSAAAGPTGASTYDASANDDVGAGADYSLTGNGTATGTASINPNTGVVSYTPDPSEAGSSVTVEYEVCPDGVASGGAGCDTATVTFAVDAYDAVNDSAAAGPTGASTYDVSANDDVGADADYSLTGNGTATGTASINPNTGVITYTPDPSEAGTSVTVEYEVCPDGVTSGGTGCDTATVTFGVGVPVLEPDEATTAAHETVTIDPTENDTGIPNGSTFDLPGSGSAAGAASIDPDTGVVTYTPDSSEAGSTVTLDYRVCTPAGGTSSPACVTSTISIAVSGVTVTGRVYLDADRDGARDPGASSIGQVEVTLIEAGPDGQFGTADDVVVDTAVTASPYSFADVASGVYRVQVDRSTLPVGVFVTDDVDGGQDDLVSFEVGSHDVSDLDLGYFYAAVSGVFTGSDGLPVGGARVTITDAAGTTWVVTTDDAGRFFIEGAADKPIAAGQLSVSGIDHAGVTVTNTVVVQGAAIHTADLGQSAPTPSIPALPFTGTSPNLLVTWAAGFIVLGVILRYRGRWRLAR